ncbi:MAG: integrin alpha, partial [Myxococcota bacterium]|nr:integrin alpha [Myxococcota bacterium]
IFLGPSTGLVSVDEADSTWTGESAFDEAGHAIAAAGDVDGDGLDDVLVGAPNQDGDAINGGAAYLLTDSAGTSGSLAAARGVLRGPNMGDRAGFALAGYGDVDGDGHADLAVSALGDDEGGTEAGAVYLVRGPVEGQLSLLDVYGKLTGEGRMDQAGTSLAGVGDINADGYPDLVVGAPLQDDRGTTTGAAYVIAVPQPGSHSLQNHTQFFGVDYGDHGGAAVAGIGDSNGDGRPDFVVAAPIADGHHPEVGHSYLYLGLSED